MEAIELSETLSCLTPGRTLYSYFDDQYALDLIERIAGQQGTIEVRHLKSSPYAKLLDKPIVKQALSDAGDGIIRPARMRQVDYDSNLFVLTAGSWGDKGDYLWNQMSRPGKNLVLQLNLINKDAQLVNKIFGCDGNEHTGHHHPVSQHRSSTLAWARLDIDFDNDEVLIEEIQSDLIREVQRIATIAKYHIKEGDIKFDCYGKELNSVKTLTLSEEILRSYKRRWAETMLNATLWFIEQELGVNTVFYHSLRTCKIMKGMGDSMPPTSLYTDLPRKFCFQNTASAPGFLRKNKKSLRRLKALKEGHWFVTQL